MSSNTQAPIVLSFEDARHLVERHAEQLSPRGDEVVDLLDCAGRILAEPLIAHHDFPSFRRAIRDGYAVRAADLLRLPTTLKVIGEIKAGAAPATAAIAIKSGEAVAIMTGAPAPAGSDAVVMVEYTTQTGDRVEIARGISAGDNIVPTGAEAKRGDCLLPAGTHLGHTTIAIAASVGMSRVRVFTKPRIAVLATGDEIVDIAASPGANQIRNSNTYSLAAQIQAAGGDPILLPIAPDEPVRLSELITAGLEADLLLMAGGVSMGKYDLVEQVLAEFKAEFFFTGARIQPGGPIVFGRIPCGADTPAPERNRTSSELSPLCEREGHGFSRANENHRANGALAPEGQTYFFGLPGNPVSTMVTFELFARPIIEALAGASPRKLTFPHAKLQSEIKTKPGLKRFLPAILSGEFEQAEVELVRWQGSGDIAATARANCYVVIPPDRERIAAGEWVPLLMR